MFHIKKQPCLFVQEHLCRDWRCSLEAVRKTLNPGSHQMGGTIWMWTDVAKDDDASLF